MNYRHAYHAGNFADVHKHMFLIALIRYLQRKSTPVVCLDSHAGRGVYDLSTREAQSTLEFRQGVGKICHADRLDHPWLRDYHQLLQDWRKSTGLIEGYPGSPAWVAQLLRDQDRQVLLEKQPDEAEALRQWVRQQPRAEVHMRDGYEGVYGLIPPREKRGIVLVDPPYESAEDEYSQLIPSLARWVNRWPDGVYMLWLPVKEQQQLERIARFLRQEDWPDRVERVLLAECSVHATDNALALNGSAVLLVNPPWTFAEEATAAQAELWSLLSPDRRGRHAVRWIDLQERARR